MNTNQLKRFATEARNKLKAGVAAKITTLGFDARGRVADRMKPQPIQNGCIWNGSLQTESFYRQWMSLYERIQLKGVSEVYEEAAYTWFNRLMAIRILQKNDLAAPVTEYADTARTPRIVDEARQGRAPRMSGPTRERLSELLDDDMKVTEQFALLISAWCHQNPIINACFGGIADYTELLLPSNILAEGQFIDLLNHTEFISDADYRSPELIGWLYQFYISERKDEVFAKKGKFEADEIPAATQIFTPNWIVRYMVQNTIGRIYLDNNPSERQLADKWEYLVAPSQPSPQGVLRYGELTELTAADFACGSGHILNEAFDIFYDLYILEGYSRKEAIENIFRRNLTGIDLDTRAKQLAQFALLLKACQKDSSFADGHCMPRVLDMPKVNRYTYRDAGGHFDCAYNLVRPSYDDLDAAFILLEKADTLGSIMRFDLSPETRAYLAEAVACYQREPQHEDAFGPLIDGYTLILALTQKYAALCMNPPYMGSGNMNGALSQYVKDNYAMGKADLFSVFMLLAEDRLATGGLYGMINMQSWMFLSSFESLRSHVLQDSVIENMLHLGPRTFDELSGEVVQNSAFVIRNTKPSDTTSGTYYRLVDGKDCADKKRLFLESGNKIYYPNIPQDNFKKIPGSPIGYWVSEKMMRIMQLDQSNVVLKARHGILTGDDNKYLRLWQEVSFKTIGLECTKFEDVVISDFTFYPMNKGGGGRRWYGNNYIIIRIKGCIQDFNNNKLNEKELFFKEGITWTEISGFTGMRYSRQGNLFGHKGATAYFKDKINLYLYLGYSNSIVYQQIKYVLNTGLSFTAGNVERFPYRLLTDNNQITAITSLVNSNISISRMDWDAHETSWDFQQNELVAINNNSYIDIMYDINEGTGLMADLAAPHSDSLEWRLGVYKDKWEDKFSRLHRNEEELNRQFISIYGLEDELTPDVPLSEITILQDGEISIDNETLTWHDDVVMKQLVSYAVGCWMGRYRLDKPGLHIAHPNPTDEELAPYIYKGELFEIDDDGIIPLMANDCGFSDNASIRLSDFIRTVLGEQKHVDNLNYLEQKLGKTIETYLIKDFWKDHKRMYQNRPIYWLFSSKKGAFQCIAYMHRIDAYTAERVRAKYLLPFIEHLQARVTELENRASALSTRETKQLDTMRKQLDECREYHDRLQVVAEQAISFDLDDGVTANYAKFGDILAKIK